MGRLDFMVRTRLHTAAWRGRWHPVLGAATLCFRRSLRPFAHYELKTRVLGWDAKWFYFEQRFEAGGKTAAVGHVRGLFRCRHGSVPTEEVLAAAGFSGATPELPGGVATWAD